MEDAAIPPTLEGTKQNQFQIANLKLPLLPTKNIQTHLHHFHLRSEATNAPPLALFSNNFFRTGGSSGTEHTNRRFQKPIFISNNPLNMFTDLFSKSKQGSEAENSPPLLAKLFSNTTTIQLWKPGSIPNNPFNMCTELFSQIKQDLGMEARKFCIIQKIYLKECIKRSESAGIYKTVKAPETANAAVSKFKNDLGFLVRLFLEIMEGPEGTKMKAACDNAWLRGIYSNMESKVGSSEMPSPPPNSGVATNNFPYASSYQNSTAISGFISMLNNKRDD
ncbi:hypothetical protein VNO78_33061 [Psophocarpus tetragonolobus]|uniref:Uncharacterized protein n=1 Tax=Psophocarpus tetragonolobus TaxID=3891 RepID=A0AAN9P1G7_PSOTE